MLNHFFSLEMGYLWTFALEFKLLPTKKTCHVIYHWIRNFKYIINIKLPFVKNDMGNFDYALTLKKSLDTSLLLYAKTRKYILLMFQSKTQALKKKTSYSSNDSKQQRVALSCCKKSTSVIKRNNFKK